MRPPARWLLQLALAGAFTVCGITPYVDDNFSTINGTLWTSNGTVSGGTYGLTSTGAGSVISTNAQALYEVVADLGLTNTVCGGSYTVYLRATSNALHGPTPQGSYYAAHIALDGTGTPTAGCGATLSLVSRIGGSIQTLASVPLGVKHGSQVRALVRPNGILTVMVDSRQLYWGLPSPALASGSPGVGVLQTPVGNGISHVKLNALELVVPPAVNISTIDTSTAPNRVELRWRGVEEPAAESGLWRYDVYRNGTYLNSVRNSGFVDATTAAGTTYTYWIVALDYHMNRTTATFPVTTPAAGSFDARRTGVKPMGAYWGAGGENIDMNSGNLNYTSPLLKVVGRGSTSFPINLSYNSQQWRRDTINGTNTVWKLGEDVGYGFGWKLQMGSLQAIYSDYWTVSYILYTDATGAEYRLMPAGNGLYTSTEGIYVTYDAATAKLWFNDGTFWKLDAISWGNEDDAGTQYPTLIEDSNGNQIKLNYLSGSGAGWANSSARIEWIDDPRGRTDATTHSYTFSYNTDSTPHLTGINSTFNGGERYSFAYSQNVTLTPPWTSGTNFGTTATLFSASNTTAGGASTFTYSTAAELTKVVLPLGADLQWEYADFTYANQKTYREVSYRRLRPESGGAQWSYQLYNDPGDTARQAHASRGLIDQGSGALKLWTFNSDSASSFVGLLTKYEEGAYPSLAMAHQKDLTWQLSSSGNPYVAAATDTLDPGTSDQVASKVTQTIDGYGNMTVQNLFNYGDLVNPARVYNSAYLSTASYVNAYIRNRLSSATLTSGGQTTTLVENTYDDYGSALGYSNMCGSPSIQLCDSAYASATVPHGNRTMTRSLSDDSTKVYLGYNSGGEVTSWKKANGVVSTAQYTAATNYLAPSQIVPSSNSSLAVSMTFNSTLGLTGETDANGASLSIGYDAANRPSATGSPYGAVTTYSYSSPTVSSATTNGRVVTTTKDGLGRVRQVSGPTGIVDTEYAPCACSPLGKVKRVSKPHASNETPIWTTYTYDVLGRTTLITLPPDAGQTSAGLTSYQFRGNTVKTTDPSGKWRLYKQDAFGNLVEVREPNPAGGQSPASDYVTSYTYNVFNKLTVVTMPRPTGTQTRTFTYNAQQRLSSVQQPENGTTTYGFDNQGRTAWKQDAKGQKVVYTYDTSDRVTMEQRYLTSNGPEVTAQRTTYYYDQDPDGGTGGYWAGRVAKILHGSGLVEKFRYTQAGLTASKSTDLAGLYPLATPATVDYAYNDEGRPTAMAYPQTGFLDYRGYYYQYPRLTLAYSYAGNGQMSALSRADTGLQLVSNAQYGVGGRLLSLQRASGVTLDYNSRLPVSVDSSDTETFSYNALGQMTSQSWSGVSKQYNFTAGANDGRVSQVVSSPGETVSYTYDTLGRLSTAATSSPAWGLNWVYDGFGNRLQQNVTKGTGISVQMSVDPATNRLLRSDIAYDANGNLTNWTSAQGTVALTYDIDNRVTQVTAPNGVETYAYTARNQRVVKSYPNNGDLQPKMEVYGARGEWLGEYSLCQVPNGQYQGRMGLCTPQIRVYFAGRPVLRQSGEQSLSGMMTDRLGSAIQTFPYGDTLSTVEPDKESFATYTRDGVDGLDYAQNRYYSSTWGRFLSADPYQASGGAGNPASWNRYAYVENDPVGFRDPAGLLRLAPWDPNDPDPGGGPPGVTGPAPRIPCLVTANSLLKYMLSVEAYSADGTIHYTNEDKHLATLKFAEAIMLYAEQYNVDPRLLVAISFLESKWGADGPAARTQNAFGLMVDEKLIDFSERGQGSGWIAGIKMAAITVSGLMAAGLTTVELLYSGKRGAYCVGAQCVEEEPIVRIRFAKQGGDTNDMEFPCERVEGRLVQKIQ